MCGSEEYVSLGGPQSIWALKSLASSRIDGCGLLTPIRVHSSGVERQTFNLNGVGATPTGPINQGEYCGNNKR